MSKPGTRYEHQDEWYIYWHNALDLTSWAVSPDTGSMMMVDDPCHAHGNLGQIFMDATAQTMIYTEQQAKALADESVALAEASAKAAAEREGKSNEPLSEEEKARLWRAVMESCSG